MYLDFASDSEYIEFLVARNIMATHLALANTTTNISPDPLVQSVTFWAILSHPIIVDTGISAIACCGSVLLQTNSANLTQARYQDRAEAVKTQVQDLFREYRNKIERNHLKVFTGKWTHKTPNYMN